MDSWAAGRDVISTTTEPFLIGTFIYYAVTALQGSELFSKTELGATPDRGVTGPY
jgi:hypothetical protein